MRLLNYLLAFLSLAGLALVGWWGVYQSPQSAANLEAKLQAAAETALADAGADWARVKVDGQTATLTGSAPSADTSEQIAQLVLESSGAGGRWMGGIINVDNRFDAAPPVSPYVWRATKTETGALILSGHVPTLAIRQDLMAEASGLSGVEVQDQMNMAAGVPKGNWQGVARLGLRQLNKLDSGEARLKDHELRVAGVAMDDAVRAQVSAEVANLAAPFRGEPVIKGRALWSAVHAERGLVLTGQVSSEEERAEIATIAQSFYGGDVRDEMSIGTEDYDGWLDGVRLGLPHFAKFRSGQMGFAPEDEGFTFEGEASGSTLAYLRQDMQKLTGPYAVNIAAETVQVEVQGLDGLDFEGKPVEACQAAYDSVLQSNKVYFASGKADITRESGATLDQLMAVSVVCDPDLMFELGGHTDNQGQRGFNVTLSEARAASVADYMADAGFDRDRLSAKGYGPDVPVGDNETVDGRAKNRRIEFKVFERSE
jgi:OOP family OmpA-OmpF porin